MNFLFTWRTAHLFDARPAHTAVNFRLTRRSRCRVNRKFIGVFRTGLREGKGREARGREATGFRGDDRARRSPGADRVTDGP